MSNRAKALASRVKLLNLKQRDLAQVAGLDEATVSQALTGRRNSYSSTLDALERAVALKEDELRQRLNALPASDAERKEVA